MKKFTYTIKKTLLFAMLLFVMHDFVLEQIPIFTDQKQVSIDNAQVSQTSLSNSEHNLIHAPFLLEKHFYSFEKKSKTLDYFGLEEFAKKEILFLIDTPPKIA